MPPRARTWLRIRLLRTTLRKLVLTRLAAVVNSSTSHDRLGDLWVFCFTHALSSMSIPTSPNTADGTPLASDDLDLEIEDIEQGIEQDIDQGAGHE